MMIYYIKQLNDTLFIIYSITYFGRACEPLYMMANYIKQLNGALFKIYAKTHLKFIYSIFISKVLIL